MNACSLICFVGKTRQPYATGTKKDAINEQFFNRTQNDAIWGLIALFLANQNAGNTTDFKMNVIKGIITPCRMFSKAIHTFTHI